LIVLESLCLFLYLLGGTGWDRGENFVDLNVLMVFFLGWEVDWLAKFLNYVAPDRRFIKYG